MDFLTVNVKCRNGDTTKVCPMHSAYVDMTRRALLQGNKLTDLTPAQRKRLAINCIQCQDAEITLTDPGMRRAQRGFRPVGETLDV